MGDFPSNPIVNHTNHSTSFAVPAQPPSSSSQSFPTTAEPATSSGIIRTSRYGSCKLSILQASEGHLANPILTNNSTECNTGIMAGTLPTLKPLFKRFLGTYGSQSKTSRQYPGSKKYKMHSMSRSRGPPLQSRHKSGNLSIAEYDAEPNIQRSQIASTAGSATYAGSRGSNSSEERILPVQGDGIVRTTEVIVSREQNIPEPPPSPPVVSKLSRMGSLSGLRVNAEDRV